MPSNIEIKAKIDNIPDYENIAKKIGAEYIETLEQTDTYYSVNSGKLKLREFTNKISELIFYDRYGAERWQSDYIIVELSDTKNLKKIFSMLFDIRVIVKKKRKLYKINNARIHLDLVEGLGSFLEFESVVVSGDEQARTLLEWLIEVFNIKEKDIIRSSYSDLLLKIGKIDF